MSRNLGSTFIEDTLGNLVAKMPQGAIFATTMYLLSNQPAENNSRATVHKEAIAGLALVRATLNTDANSSMEIAVEPRCTTARLCETTIHHIATVRGKNYENEDHVAMTPIMTSLSVDSTRFAQGAPVSSPPAPTKMM
jgi:hypothetical protein